MKRRVTFKNLKRLLPLVLSCSVLTAHATYTPVAVTGFNHDIVANGVGAATSSTTADVDGVNYNFVAPDFQATVSSPQPTYALPASGIINSVATSGLTYQLESYSSNNALRIATLNGTGTLSLVTPTAAGEIYILGVSGSGKSDFNATVTFSDASTQTFTGLEFKDWYDGTNFAIKGIGRVKRTDNALEGNTENPRLYQLMLALDPANYTKDIVSISFEKTNNSGVLIVMGITTNDVCNGFPSSGQAVASVNSVGCPTASFTLTLTGHSTGVGTTYEWESSPVGSAVWTSMGAATSTPNFTVTGQNMDMEYRAIVTCTNGGFSDVSAPVTVTGGGTGASLPYFEGFENITTANTLPSCMAATNLGGTFTTYLAGTTYNRTPKSGSKFASFRWNSKDTLYTAPLNLTGGNSYRFKLWYITDGASGFDSLAVYFTDAQNSTGTFTHVAKVPFPNNTTYQMLTGNFTAPASGNYHLAITHFSVSSSPWYLTIDDILVEDLPSCTEPTALNFANPGPNSADLAWSDWNGASTWSIEYGPVGFTPGNGTFVQASSNPFTLTGLSPNTAYTFYVRSLCSATDSSAQSAAQNFMTTQIPVSSFPWIEDFETGGTEWTVSNGTQTNKWFVGTAVAASGTHSLYVSNDNGASNTYSTGNATVVHAYRDITFPAGVNNIDLSFQWRADGEGTPTGSNWDYIRVWLVPVTFSPTPGSQIGAGSGGTQLGGTFVDQASFTSANVTIPGSFAGTTMRLVFEWRNDGSGGVQPPGAVDNIMIYAGDCVVPTGVTATNPTSSTVVVNWTENGTATQWSIEYGPAGFSLGTGTFVQATSAPVTLTGLNPSTTYAIYVRSICSATDSSLPAGPATATTHQIPVSVFPWTEDFETGGTEWTISNGSQTNKWFVGTAVANGGTQSLYISNNNGVNNQYSTGNASVVHAYRDINFPAGVSAIELFFDYRNDGEGTPTGSNWDYIRVWLVPATYMPTPGSQISSGSGRVQLGGAFVDQLTFTTANLVIPGTFAGTSSRLVFEWRNDASGGAQPPAAIDNVSIVIGTCGQPSALGSANPTPNSVDLSWTSPGSLWEIEYGQGTFALGSGTREIANANPYTLTGLSGGTNYSYYVREICSPGDSSSWAGPVSFTTACPASFMPDFMQDFSTYEPLCWTEQKGALTSAGGSLTVASNAWTGDDWLNTVGHAKGKAAKINLYITGKRDWLVTPSIDLGTGGTYYLQFNIAFLDFADDFSLNLGSDDTLAVVISTDNGATWSLSNVLDLYTSSNTSFTSAHVTIPLSAYTGVVKFGFYASEGVVDDINDVDVMVDNITITSTPLSIRLASITAANHGLKNRIDWKSASEDAGDKYTVERSTDGRDFIALETVDGKGIASSYSYWDENAVPGINYYRVRMTDAAGLTTYSNIVTATVKGKFGVQAFPNPATDKIVVRVAGEMGSNARIVVTDITGKVVASVANAASENVISVQNLATGLYLVKYSDDLRTETIKVNKQ